MYITMMVFLCYQNNPSSAPRRRVSPNTPSQLFGAFHSLISKLINFEIILAISFASAELSPSAANMTNATTSLLEYTSCSAIRMKCRKCPDAGKCFPLAPLEVKGVGAVGTEVNVVGVDNVNLARLSESSGCAFGSSILMT